MLSISVFLFFSRAYDTTGLSDFATYTYSAIAATAITYLVVRHGLLAFVTCNFFAQVFLTTILTLDPTDWYFVQTAIVALLVTAMTIFGVRTSTDRALLPHRGQTRNSG